ncbi:alcohol dehydrogenase, partial [Cellulomonas bogoriensis 69B4 = DSM 16987]
ALALGAHAALHPDDAAHHLRTTTQDRGVHGADVVLEIAGTDAAVALSVELAAPGATVVLTGIPDADTTTFPASTARRKGLTLKLSRRMKEMYPRAVRLAAGGTVDLTSLVTETAPLTDAVGAFTRAQARHGLKVVIAPHL